MSAREIYTENLAKAAVGSLIGKSYVITLIAFNDFKTCLTRDAG